MSANIRAQRQPSPADDRPRRVCVVGSGKHFLSGISYYTMLLANALSRRYRVSSILMRRLLPAFLYPGRKRIGQPLAAVAFDPSVRVVDGVDWYWRGMGRAAAFLLRERPDVLILQWWTGTVLHSYIALALLAKLLGARVVVEYHEVLDTGEAKKAWAQRYVELLIPLLTRLSDGSIVHSDFDREIIARRYKLRGPLARIPLGSFDQYERPAPAQALRPAPEGVCNLLFFGVVRPFKGLEDLVAAFDNIPPSEIGRYWLTVVGEPWEGFNLPFDLIARSRYADRITVVSRYVSDEEVSGYFAGADVVVLPYHRSSASGPLHTAMSWGLPVIVTEVGGLPEAGAEYEGAVWVPPRSPSALRAAFARAEALRGRRYADPHSWERKAHKYAALIEALPPSRRERAQAAQRAAAEMAAEGEGHVDHAL